MPTKKPTAVPDPDDSDEGVDFRPDGRVGFVFDGTTRVLHRPRFGQFQKLKERLRAVNNAQRRINSEQAALGIQLPTETDEVKREEIEARMFELGAANDHEVIDWVVECFAILCPDALPESLDDWPLWLTTGAFIDKVIAHWREVPLVRGGR